MIDNETPPRRRNEPLGFEPRHFCLAAMRLLQGGEMERSARFELASTAWKAEVLPLDEPRLVAVIGFAPMISGL